MRNRWFHAPVFHTHHHGQKKVSWLELFYDLIFVAAIIQLGDTLSSGVATRGLGMFIQFAAHFIPLLVAWTGFTFFANRFTVDDFFHRSLVFVKMFAVGAMAIAAPEAMAPEAQPAKFALAYAIAQACVALMYLRGYRQVPESRDYCRYWGGVFAFGAVCWAVSTLLPTPYNYGLWVVGLMAVISAPMSKSSRVLLERMPQDMGHLSERYGMLTIIVLGESFVTVLSYLAIGEHPATSSYLLKVGANLVITCCIWWVYFDAVAGARLKKGAGSFVIWLYGHIPLTIAITAVGVGMKLALASDLSQVASAGYRWLVAGSVALTLLSVAMIDSVTRPLHAQLSDGWRVNARFFGALLVLLLGQVGASMKAGLFLGLVAAVCVAQVLFDMMIAPLAEQQDTPRAVPIAQLAARADEPHKDAAPVRRDVAESIRKGTPSDLRRDLYFYFIEGTWTRLLLSFAVIYLLLNVMFACLFLLEAGSFGGPTQRSFADAFAFSVQTMSTIGYGVLSPQTAYGDLIVTLEAATSILLTALATGLMFAKASQPRASVLFSDTLVITMLNGKRTLMFRAGNARGNDMVEASMSLTVMRDETSPEGQHSRRLYDLPLLRSRSPLFSLSWSVMHVLDENSPLADVDWDQPDKKVLAFIATLLGHDSTYGQTTHARHVYYPENIRSGQHFVDVISQLEDGRLMIDYGLFHDTEPDTVAEPSA